MHCNCNTPENTILCTQGTSCSITFEFDTDISSFKKAVFAVRKDYNTAPAILKEITDFTAKTINLILAPEDTATITFRNGENQSVCIWGLDLEDEETNTIVNVFPATGEHAPLFVVYKHVVED